MQRALFVAASLSSFVLFTTVLGKPIDVVEDGVVPPQKPGPIELFFNETKNAIVNAGDIMHNFFDLGFFHGMSDFEKDSAASLLSVSDTGRGTLAKFSSFFLFFLPVKIPKATSISTNRDKHIEVSNQKKLSTRRNQNNEKIY
ncbi:hypothetical protein AB6A40_004364 [Gnathostoma spinigerum]|uniref:Uncharacterized protein n=1 Tax=Gnathostoma spinigerum TaxID=75299 RepID=A0ABD6EMY8_9BILA